MTTVNESVSKALRIVQNAKDSNAGSVGIRYAVSIEVCHILSEYDARRLAEKIRDRLDDIPEDVYVCVSEYEQVRAREKATGG